MTTREQIISEWFDNGVSKNATHLIVKSDFWDEEDYPVYAFGLSECVEKSQQCKHSDRVIEVYKLSEDKREQISRIRCWNI